MHFNEPLGLRKSAVSTYSTTRAGAASLQKTAAESILFIYRVLFAVCRNKLIYIPRQHNAVSYILLWGLPTGGA